MGVALLTSLELVAHSCRLAHTKHLHPSCKRGGTLASWLRIPAAWHTQSISILLAREGGLLLLGCAFLPLGTHKASPSFLQERGDSCFLVAHSCRLAHT